jgi:hypothetical protein
MAVPNTDSGWSLDTVRAELGLATNTSLTACIASANSQGGWDPVYSGSKNSLLNFRNFAVPTTQEFYLTVNTPKSSFACYGTANNVAYHNGDANTIAAVGDTVYSNSAGTITYPAGTYGQTFYSGGYIGSRIVVNSSGVVTAYYLC